MSDAAAGASDLTPGKRLASGPQSCLCQFEASVAGAEEGMSVSLLGSHPLLGEWDLARAVPMIPTARSTFAASMHLPVDTDLEYRYLVKSAPRWDAVERHMSLSSHTTAVRHLLDHDKAPPGRRYLPRLSLTSDHKLRKGSSGRGGSAGKHVCKFRLELAGGLADGQWVGVAGDDKALGGWDLTRCLAMQEHKEHGNSIWSAEACFQGGRVLAYKYVIVTPPRWESHVGNRCLSLPPCLAEWQVSPPPPPCSLHAQHPAVVDKVAPRMRYSITRMDKGRQLTIVMCTTL